LADAGIGTVAELAETEPDEVAEVAEVSESRATDFVRKARER
jgi:predicted RecB family nuclease